jgi:hypothetical protein
VALVENALVVMLPSPVATMLRGLGAIIDRANPWSKPPVLRQIPKQGAPCTPERALLQLVRSTVDAATA